MKSWVMTMIMDMSCLAWKYTRMTGKSVSIAAVSFTETGFAAAEPTVERILIVPIAMKPIIVPTVVIALIIQMICVKIAASVSKNAVTAKTVVIVAQKQKIFVKAVVKNALSVPKMIFAQAAEIYVEIAAVKQDTGVKTAESVLDARMPFVMVAENVLTVQPCVKAVAENVRNVQTGFVVIASCVRIA